MSKEEKLVEQAREHLDADESVLISAFGAYETKMMGQDTVRNGVLIATERRVVFYAKRFGGHELESFSYKNVSSFESGKNMMGGTITFYASGNKVHLKWVAPADQANVFVMVVRKRLDAISSAPQQQVEPKEDLIAKIQQLAGLRDSGILTEEEFTAKKAELLAQI